MVYPLSSVIKASFLNTEGTAVSLEAYAKLIANEQYRDTILNSIFLGLLAAAGALTIGVPMAYVVARCDVPGKSYIKALGSLPIVFPSFAIGWAWIVLLGRNGLVTVWFRNLGIESPPIYGWHGVAFVFIFTLFPVIFLMVSGALNSIDASLEEAARNLGSSDFRVFYTVTLPLITPSIVGSALLVFILAIENFGVPIILGERFSVLSVEAYLQFMSELGGNPATAGAMSMILVTIATITLLIQRYYVARKEYGMSLIRLPETKILGRVGKILAIGYCGLVILISLIPLLVIAVASFAKARGPVLHPEFSLANYAKALTNLRPILNSYFLSTVATIVCVLISVFVAYVLVRRRSLLNPLLDTLFMFPYAIAGVILGIGLIVAFNRPPLILTGTWIILVVSYFVRKSPATLRSASSILYQIDTSIEEASINLGVSPLQTFFKITLRLMAPALIPGAILTWVTIMGELSSTIVLYYGPWATMTIQILQEILSADFGPACALSVILVLSVLIPVMIVNKISAPTVEQVTVSQ
jgi:iron(III) transport system permease protein